MNNQLNISMKVVKCYFIFLVSLVLFSVVSVNVSQAQINETVKSSKSGLSQEELAMRAEEAKAITEVVLLAIKNGALGDQFANINSSPNTLSDNVALENQSKKIDALQASYDNANLRLDKMFKIIIVLFCFLMAQLLLIISLYYFLLKKFQV